MQAESFGILRNIACNDAADIDLALHGIGEARLFMILEEALYHTRFDMLLNVRIPSAVRLHSADVDLQALYLVVNMATGTESHRSAILNRQGIIRAIHAHLVSPRSIAVNASLSACFLEPPGIGDSRRGGMGYRESMPSKSRRTATYVPSSSSFGHS